MPYLSKQEIQDYRNKERLYKEQREQNKQLRKTNKKLKKEIEEQKNTIAELTEAVQTLKVQIEDLTERLYGRKKKHRGKDTDTDQHQTPGRKKKKPDTSTEPENCRRSVPAEEEITHEKHHSISHCAHCNTPLSDKEETVFYEEDLLLPEAQPLKTTARHTVERGWCFHCRRWRPAVPLPPVPVVLGGRLRAFTAYAHTILRLSYAQIISFLETFSSLTLSEGEITRILTKEADTLRPAFHRLLERLRNEPVVHYDETPYPLQETAETAYGWVMTSARTTDTAFLLGRSRGKGNAEELHRGTSHIGVTDNYGAYRNLFGTHQLCLAHPHRKLRDLKDLSSLGETTQGHCREVYERFAALYRALRTYTAGRTEPAPRSTYTAYRRTLQEIAAPDERDPAKLRRLKEELRQNTERYLTCLRYPGVPTDNNRAERALRPLVLKRRTSFGCRTKKGAETLSILSSILFSSWWHDKQSFFKNYLELREAEER